MTFTPPHAVSGTRVSHNVPLTNSRLTSRQSRVTRCSARHSKSSSNGYGVRGATFSSLASKLKLPHSFYKVTATSTA
eukprot:2926662-Pyramimonas_sp.AAC.1